MRPKTLFQSFLSSEPRSTVPQHLTASGKCARASSDGKIGTSPEPPRARTRPAGRPTRLKGDSYETPHRHRRHGRICRGDDSKLVASCRRTGDLAVEVETAP